MNSIFRITGQKKLTGTIEVSGSKNAALPILAASIAIPGISKISNLPNISDVDKFLDMLQTLGAKVSPLDKGGLGDFQIDTSNLIFTPPEFDHYGIKKMRASILLLAPLLARFGEVKLPFPGGCVLGKRSADTHLRAFSSLGAEIIESTEYLHLKLPNKKFVPGKIVLPEISVTATENAIVAACFADGISEIRLAAAEPHVQNLCELMVSAGIHIEGIGTHTLKIHGGTIKNYAEISVTPDYLQAGTFLFAGIATDSEITIKNIVESHLDSVLEKLHEIGANFEINSPPDKGELEGVLEKEKMITITTLPRKKDFEATKIDTGVFPKFPTDLHPQFAVLLTQCHGTSKIFETLFERKFAYLLELEKMGANVEILNPHQFLIHGPKKLIGAPVASQDIRAGAAMIVAALAAEGETEISNIHYIDRGYEKLEKNMKNLGAEIKREEK